MDSHASAQLAFGRRFSVRSAGRAIGSTLLGRATGATTSRRLPHHRKAKSRHTKRGKFPTHHRRSGVVIPNEMLKMLVFTSVIRAIRD